MYPLKQDPVKFHFKGTENSLKRKFQAVSQSVKERKIQAAKLAFFDRDMMLMYLKHHVGAFFHKSSGNANNNLGSNQSLQ